MLVTNSNWCTFDRAFLRDRAVTLPSCAVRVSILIAYIFSWVGVPVGECRGTNALSHGTKSCCRCSLHYQQSGQCCCARNRASGSRFNCCSTKAKISEQQPGSSTRSCCKSSGNSSGTQDPVWPRSSRPSLKSTCDCGAKDMEGLLVCHEPRVLAQHVKDIDTPALGHRVLTIDPSHKLGDRQRPPIPPPKSPRR